MDIGKRHDPIVVPVPAPARVPEPMTAPVPESAREAEQVPA
jgi:hypothetical protein